MMKNIPDSEPYHGLASLLPDESICDHLWIVLYDAHGMRAVFQHANHERDTVVGGVFLLMAEKEAGRRAVLQLALDCHARDAAICVCEHNRQMHEKDGICDFASPGGLEHLGCGCPGYRPKSSLHQS